MKGKPYRGWSIRDYATLAGQTEEYVRACCRRDVNARTGNVYSLPERFVAKKNLSGNWMIYLRKRAKSK